MNLTERERTILKLAQKGLSDYKIARKINTDPPSVTRSKKNAEKKLTIALAEVNWAIETGLKISEFNTYNSVSSQFHFFL